MRPGTAKTRGADAPLKGGPGGGRRGGISEAALQKLNRAKQELGEAKDVLGESAHGLRREYCTLIEDVMFSDLEYAIGRKLEQDLWNVGFRAAITALQKNAQASREGALKLGLMIDLSSAYYLQLLQRLVERYRVAELKMMPTPESLGVIDIRDEMHSSEQEHIRIAKRSRVLYICQYCLVHLGDLARYRRNIDLAEGYYRQAVEADPRNGHPYNQLGLLEGARGARLATVFMYVRALSVSHPFVVAITNIESIYSKLILEEQQLIHQQQQQQQHQNQSGQHLPQQGHHHHHQRPQHGQQQSHLQPGGQGDSGQIGDQRVSSEAEATRLFLHFVALVHLDQQMALARKLLTRLMAALPKLVCAGKIDASCLLQMATVSLYTFNRCTRTSAKTAAGVKAADSKLPKSVDVADPESGAALISEMTFGLFRCVLLANVGATPNDGALPTALLFLEALVAAPKAVSMNPVKDLWAVLRTALNALNRTQPTSWTKEALPEDFELRGFLPLRAAQSRLDFGARVPPEAACELRRSRFVKQASDLCKVMDGALIAFVDGEFRAKNATTEDDLVKELERVRLDEEEPPKPAAVRFDVDEPEQTGVDQGRRESLRPNKRQNVALQAIMNQRQVPPPEPIGVPMPNPSMAFRTPPPPLGAPPGAPRWAYPPPPGGVPPSTPALMHPSGTYMMTIDELVRQPPPPIYNVDLRLVPPPPAPNRAPAPTPGMGFNGSPMAGHLGQGNSYSLFSGGAWNPAQMGVQMTPPLLPMGGLPGAAPRPQGGSLWKPEKGAQATSALERLLKETKRTKDP